MPTDEKRTGPARKIYKDPSLHIIFAVTLMAVMGVSSISPALPGVIKDLGVSSGSIGLLITMFTLPGVILTPFLGVLADRLGRKKIMVPSLMIFGLAGGACAFAKDFQLLLVLRFFQGAGAAALGSLNVTLIGDFYSGQDRNTVMGYNASVLSVGTAAYPAIGGALAMLGWNYPFALPFIGLVVGLVVLFWLNNPEPESRQTLKSYLAGAFGSMKTKKVLGLFTASVGTFIILYGCYLTYFPIFAEKAFNASPLVIGLVITLSSLSTATTSWNLGRITRRFPERVILRASYALFVLATVLFTLVTELWMLVLPVIIFGMAMGTNVPIIQTTLAGLAPMQYRAAFMSLNGTVLRLGQTLGPIIMGAVFGVWGIQAVFYAGAAAAGVMLVLVFLMIRK